MALMRSSFAWSSDCGAEGSTCVRACVRARGSQKQESLSVGSSEVQAQACDKVRGRLLSPNPSTSSPVDSCYSLPIHSRDFQARSYPRGETAACAVLPARGTCERARQSGISVGRGCLMGLARWAGAGSESLSRARCFCDLPGSGMPEAVGVCACRPDLRPAGARSR
ncbi:hypothetical protein CALCODRAFT_208554 [Calocera cornea HHB12733]|uniref:Uncharacterized protein n=1 Tax=Calocera cornea HHB12733 TaxID=1353952 RepID=A0A165HD25_9BASI|nr:hypothetical protein CALCODRAFT_208554 [Calocera cornea HHB12733]